MPSPSKSSLADYQVNVIQHDQDGLSVSSRTWTADKVPEHYRCANHECHASREDKKPTQYALDFLVRGMINAKQTEKQVACEGGILWPHKRAGLTKPTKRCLCKLTIQVTLNSSTKT